MCLELDGPFSADVYPALIDLAKKEAPGAVAYLEVQQAIAGTPLGGSCSDDIDVLQAYVDGGGTVNELSTVARFHAFSLVGSISSWCSLQTGGEYLGREQVKAFLQIG